MIRRPHVIQTITGLFAVVTMLVSTVVPASAATSSIGGGNGLRVSPVLSDFTINAGTSKTLDVYITNVTAKPAAFQVVINDFIASGDESGNPALILDEGKSAPSHSLRQFIPALSDVTVAAGEQKDVKVPITVPANAPAGGYFGAVRFAASNQAGANQNVALSASVASLVLVKVPGNYKEQMSIESIDTRNSAGKIHSIFTKNKDINAVVRFKNMGDVQEIPFGKITVKKMGGSVVYSTEINNGEQPGNVLPDSIRKFKVPLKNIGSFGKYTIQGDFGYGKGQTLTGSTTFYVMPLPIIISAIVLIVLAIVLIVEVPRLIRRYNRRVLRRAGRK